MSSGVSLLERAAFVARSHAPLPPHAAAIVREIAPGLLALIDVLAVRERNEEDKT